MQAFSITSIYAGPESWRFSISILIRIERAEVTRPIREYRRRPTLPLNYLPCTVLYHYHWLG